MAFPTFKKKDEIPKGFEDSYVEKDGEWVFKEPTADTTSIDKLQSALDKERGIREKAEKAAKELQKQIDDAETKRKAGEAGISDEKLKEIRDGVRSDLEKEYAPFKATAETSTSELRTLRLDQAVKNVMAIKEVGVKPARFEALWTLIKDRFDLTTDGKPMIKAHPGVEVKSYLADAIKKEYFEFYEGTQASGGGAAGQQGAGGTDATLDFAAITANPGAALQAARESGAKE